MSKNTDMLIRRDMINYVFSYFFKTPLFRAKIIKATTHLNRYIIDTGFNDGFVRIFILNELFIFANEVNSINLEIY
jgi:hypothetical protein